MSGTGATCLIGLDLGTAKSGYTYSFDVGSKSIEGPESWHISPQSIKTPGSWPGESITGAAKTDTALLYEVQCGRWAFKCWGKAAVKEYADAASEGRSQQYRLIRGKQFKLALAAKAADQALAQKAADLAADFRLPADCPPGFTEAYFLEQMLRCLLNHAAEHIKTTHNGFDIHTSRGVHYCLSVPAGWSPAAKHAVKQAAEKAGMRLVPQLDAQKSSSRDQDDTCRSAGGVSLVYEQEAAALTACYDPFRSYPRLKAHPGQVWVILDAGGGTVDIAMHKVQPSSTAGYSQLAEVIRSRCLLAGASLLDEQFELQVLSPLLGSSEAYQRWKQQQPDEYMAVMDSWEAIKCNFGKDSKQQAILLLPLNFILALRPDSAGWPPLPKRVRSGKLDVSTADMSTLVFDPVIDPIITNLQEVLTTKRTSDQSGHVDVLLLAGGFGSNHYLRRRVERDCGQWISNLFAPEDGNRMVVIGNTVHLRRPNTILTRCSRLTYGVGVAAKPSGTCEELGRCRWDAKKKNRYCFGHFMPLLAQNDLIEVGGTVKELTVTPLPGLKLCVVNIYSTEEQNVLHTDEKHVRKEGEVHIKVEKYKQTFLGIPVKVQSCDDFEIRLRFNFVAAEVFTVEAHDVTNNRKLQTQIEFISEPADTAVCLPQV